MGFFCNYVHSSALYRSSFCMQNKSKSLGHCLVVLLATSLTLCSLCSAAHSHARARFQSSGQTLLITEGRLPQVWSISVNNVLFTNQHNRAALFITVVDPNRAHRHRYCYNLFLGGKYSRLHSRLLLSEDHDHSQDTRS